MGQILRGYGLLSQEQLERALQHAGTRGSRLGAALIELRLCEERDIARALAEQNDIPFVDFQETAPSHQALRLIPKHVAQEYGIIPVRIEDDRLLVAVRNPYDFRIDAVIRQHARMAPIIASAPEGQMTDLLTRYDELSLLRTPLQAVGKMDVSGIAAVEGLIEDAVRRGARDITFEPDGRALQVRARIDGFVLPLTTIAPHLRDAVIGRVCGLNGMTAGVRQGASEGGSTLTVEGREVRIRATVWGSAQGQYVCLRVLEPELKPLALDGLGLEPEALQQLRAVVARRSGMVLVAAPLASGKPTTLHAIMGSLEQQGARVMSLERGFHRPLPNTTRLQLSQGEPKGVPHALQRCLDDGADVVLLGDVPDRETAEIALRAAAGGRLILASLNAPDAVTGIFRLLDLGIPAHEVAAGLSLVVSQRLLRRVCSECASVQEIPDPLRQALQRELGLAAEAQFRKGRGCRACQAVGYRGVTGVFEVLPVDDDVTALLSLETSRAEIRRRATGSAFRSLERDALDKALRGVTSAEEILRLNLAVSAAAQELAPAAQ